MRSRANRQKGAFGNRAAEGWNRRCRHRLAHQRLVSVSSEMKTVQFCSGRAGRKTICTVHGRALKDIRANDEIQIQTATGLSRFEVDSVQIVDPSDTEVLAPSAESAITLVTCYQ